MKKVVIFSDVIHPVSFTRSYGPYALKGFLSTNNPECDVKVWDQFSQRPLAYWSSLLDVVRPDVVMFSTTFWANLDQMIHADSLYTPSWWFSSSSLEFFEFCFLLKQKYSCKIVVGGHKASDIYVDVAADLRLSNAIDFLVIGHAETVVSKILATNSASSCDLNYCFKIGGTTVIKGTAQNQFELENKEYSPFSKASILPRESLIIENSRGCIYKCKFCFYPLNNRKASSKFALTRGSFLNDLRRNYEEFGTVDYIINDDTFNDSTRKLEEFVETIYRFSAYDKLRFTANIRLDNVNKRQAELLYEAKIIAALAGVESVDTKVTKAIGKAKLTPDKMVEASAYLHEANPKFKLTGSFIIGLPNSPVDQVNQTANWLNSNPNVFDGVEFDPLYVFNPKWSVYDFSSTYQLDKEFSFQEGSKLNWFNDTAPFKSFTGTVPKVKELQDKLAPKYQDTLKVFARTHLGNGYENREEFNTLIDSCLTYKDLRHSLKKLNLPPLVSAKKLSTDRYFNLLESQV
jgi:hypothetical protein